MSFHHGVKTFALAPLRILSLVWVSAAVFQAHFASSFDYSRVTVQSEPERSAGLIIIVVVFSE